MDHMKSMPSIAKARVTTTVESPDTTAVAALTVEPDRVEGWLPATRRMLRKYVCVSAGGAHELSLPVDRI